MKMTKGSLLMLLSVAVTLALTAGGTLAYLTDTAYRDNVFTMGDVEITLTDAYDPSVPLMPGRETPKEVSIHNAGLNDAYVWFAVAVPAVGTDTEFIRLIADETGDWAQETLQTDRYYRQLLLQEDGRTVPYNLHVFLYQKAHEGQNPGVLPAGESTGRGLTALCLDPAVDYDHAAGQYFITAGGAPVPIGSLDAGRLYVTAYAIQAEGFDTIGDAFAAYTRQQAGKDDPLLPAQQQTTPGSAGVK